MSTLLELSNNLADVVQTHGDHVVRVEARRRTPATGAIWSDGVVVTTSHAVEREEGIDVFASDGVAVRAQFVGRDPSTDSAVLKAAVPGKAPVWSDLDGTRVGNVVLALARPGRTVRATFGIVGALGADWRTDAGGKIDRYLQADFDLFPGFSGSLAVDAGGRVLGLCTSGLLRRHSLVVPSSTLKRVVGSLLERGRVQRGYLGIVSYPVRLPSAMEKAAGQGVGLLVAQVHDDSPAQKAGLVLGDVLVSFAGKPVTRVGELFELLDEDRIGVEVPVKLIRGGELKDLKVTVGARNWS